MMQGSGLITRGAILSLIGFVASGPVGFVMVRIAAPQPEWVSPRVFASHYSILQDVPFYFGILLVVGMVDIAAAHYLTYSDDEKLKSRLLPVLISTIVFAALICFNYICQTTFVRHLAVDYRPEHDSAIAAFSMVNPHSLCWAIEMWGYAILGVSTWLMADCYRGQNTALYLLLIINGVVSILSGVATVVSVNWVMTLAGIAAYMLWNGLMIILLILMIRHHRLIKK